MIGPSPVSYQIARDRHQELVQRAERIRGTARPAMPGDPPADRAPRWRLRWLRNPAG